MTSRSSSLPPGTPTGPPRTQQAPSSSSDGATLGDGARDRPGWRGAIVPGPALVGLWRSPAPLGGLDALRPLPELPGDRDRDPLPLLFSPPLLFFPAVPSVVRLSCFSSTPGLVFLRCIQGDNVDPLFLPPCLRRFCASHQDHAPEKPPLWTSPGRSGFGREASCHLR